MERFQYKAKSQDGKILNGRVEARDMAQAAAVLRERNLLVVELKPVRGEIKFTFLTQLIQRVKFVEVVNFTRQLSTMINAGLPLTDSLSLLNSQSSPAMHSVISEVLRDVEGGKPLGDAFEKSPKVFNSVYVSLVRAGEAAGKLDEMLLRLADNLEKAREFRSKTQGALIYPAIVVVGMIIVMFIMMVFVVPQMTEIYKDFGTELPFSTQLLVKISDFFASSWYIAILGSVGLGWAFRMWQATPVGRRVIDSVVFKIPIYGNLKREVIMAEFCRTLGLLVGAGVSIVEGLRIVSDSMQNIILQDAVKDTAKRVEKGMSVAVTLASYPDFPPILSQMLAVGEETGKVDEVLLKLAVFFETESEHLIKGLTTAIEPLIMVFLGVGVGFMVISVIMPIYNLTSQL